MREVYSIFAKIWTIRMSSYESFFASNCELKKERKSMEKLILKDESNVFYPQFLSLYDSSFPKFERRSHGALIETFKQKEFTQEIYVENSKLLALLSYWTFEKFVFLEYIAVDASLRGTGIGSKILGAFLAQLNGKACILEIDPPVDYISKKRLRFYEKLAFKQTPYKSVQTYLKHDSGQVLEILSYPQVLAASEYENFARILKSVILNPEILHL